MDRSVDHPGQVHAEKGKGRIGHRIDQALHEVRGCGRQLVVFTTERDDANRWIEPSQPRQSITVQSGAVDELVRTELADLGCDGDRIETRCDADDSLPKPDVTTSLFNASAQDVANTPEVDDSGRLDP